MTNQKHKQNITDTILKNENKNAEMFFYYNFEELREYKRLLNKSRLTFGDVRKKIYKNYGLMPSILMICCLNDNYEKYFNLRYMGECQNDK